MRVAPFSPEYALQLRRPISQGSGQSSELPGEKVSFGDELKAKIKQVDNLQHKAEADMKDGAIKGPEKIHETMISLEEADMGLRYLLKVRNKAIEAYQEIMRMQF